MLLLAVLFVLSCAVVDSSPSSSGGAGTAVCTPGMFSATDSDTGEQTCQPCPFGSSQDQSAASTCTPCTGSYYANNMGQADCDVCEAPMQALGAFGIDGNVYCQQPS